IARYLGSVTVPTPGALPASGSAGTTRRGRNFQEAVTNGTLWVKCHKPPAPWRRLSGTKRTVATQLHCALSLLDSTQWSNLLKSWTQDRFRGSVGAWLILE